jgi:PAS domain S-box-containing protein
MSQIEDKSINQNISSNENNLYSQSSHSIFTDDESNIKKLKALFDNVDVLLWSVKEYPDGDLYYEKVNDIFAAVTGRRPSDYDGKPVIELGTEEDFQQIKHSLSIARKQGIYTYEKRVGKPPEMRAFVIRMIALPGEDGSCFYIGSGTDITDRIKAEDALKEEKERAQKYLDVSGVIMLVIDKEQKVSLINRKGCEILGYAENEIIGKNWFDNFLPKRIREETKASFLKVNEGLTPVDYHENPVLTNLGVERIILWHNVVLKDEEGNFAGLLGSGEDVTERKNAERDLKRHSRSIEALYEISIEMSHATDLSDLIFRTAKLLNLNTEILAGAIYLFEKDTFNIIQGKSFGTSQSIFDDQAALELRDSFFKSVLNNHDIFVDTIFSKEATDKEIGQRISTVLKFNDSRLGFFSLVLKGIDYHTKNFFKLVSSELERSISRKKSELELIATKQLLEKIAYTSPTFISVYDTKNQKMIFSNYSLLESLGYPPEEVKRISGLPNYEDRLNMYHPDDLKSLEEFDKNYSTLKDGEILEVQHRIRDFGGKWQWFRHLVGVFSRDENGIPVQSVNIFENITEKKKAEQELISTKQLLEKITYTSPTFISVFDIKEEKILFRNYSVLESLGYVLEETEKISNLPHTNRLFMYHPDDIKAINEHDEKLLTLKDREVIEVQYRIKDSKDQWQWFRHLTAVFLRDPDGNPIQSVNIFENITEKKRAEQELISTKQLLEKITESSPAIISVLDTESDKNMYQNRSLLSVLGYNENEISNITESHDGMYQLLYSEDRSAYDRFKGKIPSMKDGKSYPLEFRIRDHQGNWQWIRRLSSIFQRSNNGTPVQIVNIFENITDYKLAEEKLSRRNDQIIKQQAALLELSKMKNYDLEDAFKLISEITSPASNAERVSIWLLNEEQQFLVCKDFYNIPFNIHESGFKLSQFDFTKLFQTVIREVNSTFDATEFDVQSKGFIEKYIIPFGTASVLTAPVRLHGDEIGYITYEIKEKLKNEWSVEEYDFVLSVSGFLSMVLETAERIKAEKEIENSLKEKELLLREIHHRVKNNLQVISSLLYLQSKKIKDKQTLDVFIESQNRVKTMVLVHEKLYQSKDFVKINHSEYIRSLINSIFQSYMTNSDAVILDLKVQNLYLNLDTTIHCGLIINELVSNSLKYAFPDERKGTIGVEFFLDNRDVYHLIVSDNGIGFPEVINFRETESLGLQLVLTLVEQLEGNIELDASSGTTFKITFTSKKI